MGKLVKIPLDRFSAGRPLTQDTYVNLALNNKSVRIAFAGGEISEEMLTRFQQKNYTHLEINAAEDIDPLTYAIHVGDSIAPGTALSAFAPSPEAPEPEQRFSADAPDSAVQVVSGGDEEPDTSSTLVKAGPAEDEESTSLSADPAEKEARTRIKPPAEEKDNSSTNVKADKEDDSQVRLGADKQEKESSEVVSGAKDEEETVRRFISKEPPPESVVFRLGKRLEHAEESIKLGKDDNWGKEKEQIFQEVKSLMMSSKISERIVSLSELPEDSLPESRSSLRAQIRSLKAVLEIIETGEEVEEILTGPLSMENELKAVAETLSGASRSEQLKEVSTQLELNSKMKVLAEAAIAKQDKEESEKSRLTSRRDLNASVSRLAAYLGHSLGYTNLNFLSDIAAGAVVHFAKKDGEPVDEEKMPALVKQLLAADTPSHDSTLDDSKDIILFLDAYISDLECDFSQKDLIKKIFDRTVDEFSTKDESPSPWSIKKWAAFVERGPSMDSHSICTRAAAMAIKSAKAYTGN